MSQRRLFIFWLPLLASWLLMAGEAPAVSAIINRLPDEVIMLAAQGVAVGLSVFIESPIINMLATSTAMVKDYDSYRLVRRFTIHWLILLTLITILIAYTPLFDVVVMGWLQAPPDVAVWIRPSLQIMTLWSAAIGWRRFLQGILIRFNRTRFIAYGTAVRLFMIVGTAVSLALWTNWAGAIIGATAIMVGLLAEAGMATLFVQPLLQNELHPDREKPAGPPLTYRALFWFHLPLAGTSALTFMAQPLIASTLSRLAQPTETLAAWPLVVGLMFMIRAGGMALQEITIAVLEDEANFVPIRRFSWTIVTGTFILTALVAFTPLSSFYLYTLQNASAEVATIAQEGYALFLIMPALVVLVAWMRGILIHRRQTPVINAGMAINLVTMLIVLGLGVVLDWPGITTGALALTFALVAELTYLYRSTQSQVAHSLLPIHR